MLLIDLHSFVFGRKYQEVSLSVLAKNKIPLSIGFIFGQKRKTRSWSVSIWQTLWTTALFVHTGSSRPTSRALCLGHGHNGRNRDYW